MSNSINKVIILGVLGADPKISNTSSGKKIASFSVATSESWKDKNTGEKQEKTEWHRVVVYNPALADIAERYLMKGSKVYLEGSLTTREWEDNNGNKKQTTEIALSPFAGQMVLLDSKKSDSKTSKVNEEWGESVVQPKDEMEDSIPF